MPPIKSHILKLSGSSESPQELSIGHNYHIALEGSITSMTDSDNEDGSITRSYKFRPIKIDVLTPKGESIKLKDTRSNSQLIRALVYKKWVNGAATMDFDTFYDRVCGSIMMAMDKLIDQAGVQ